jgi:hypothetical protein
VERRREAKTDPIRHGRSRRMITWVGGGVGALALAFASGVGSSIADWGINFYRQQIVGTSDAAPIEEGGKTPSTKTAPPSDSTGSVGQTSAMQIILKRIDLPLEGGTGTGQSEATACGAAVRAASDGPERQCTRILLEERGSSRRLEWRKQECRNCAVVGGQWSCVAEVEATCVIKGGTGK